MRTDLFSAQTLWSVSLGYGRQPGLREVPIRDVGALVTWSVVDTDGCQVQGTGGAGGAATDQEGGSGQVPAGTRLAEFAMLGLCVLGFRNRIGR